MRTLEKILIVLAIASFFSAAFVSAQPTGVDEIVQTTSSRFNTSSISPSQISAQAGNVTQLEINSTGVTTSWQGYYGNVTGTLVLADSSGNNFYDWNVSTPSGEVYASRNDSIDWVNINCPDAGNISAEETYLGQSASDPDSITNTYTLTSHPGFNVGAVSISNCPSTHAYNSSGTQATGFWQTLLSDGVDMVYSTIIDTTGDNGFNGNPWDFQLLVGENGKVGNEAVTPYYFYVELE